MRVYFHTNVDCCKKFMKDYQDISPQIGDLVVVYKDQNKHVRMEVVERTWEESEWSSGEVVLHCDLHLDHVWRTRGILEFEKWVNGR